MRATLKTFSTAKLLAASAAALGVIGLAGAGYAYNEATIQVSATVNYACQVSADFPTTTIQYTIDNLVNSDGTIAGPINSFNLGSASCNYSSTMTISNENGSLKRVGTPIPLTDNFADSASYTAELRWGDQTTILTGSGIPSSQPLVFTSPTDGDITVMFQVSEDAAHRLVEGYYTDILKVKLTSVM